MSYDYWSRITIANAQVGEDDADFAFLFSGTYNGAGGEPDLRTVANGGHVHNTDASGGASGALTVPADLVFSSSPDGSGKYDFEVELYNAATGELIAWVQSGVSSATDTVLYLVYGDAGVTTSQESVAGTWDANFVGVWHLGETGSNPTLYDSTASGFDSTENLSDPTAAGQIGGAASFTEIYWQRAQSSTSANLRPNVITVEGWVKLASSDGMALVSKFAYTGTQIGHMLCVDANDHAKWRTGGTAETSAVGYTDVADGTWHYLAGTRNASDRIDVWVDGTSEDNDTYATAFTSTEALQFGRYAYSTNYYWYLDGDLDEIRISNAARSSGYFTTCHNNQSSPSTFYSVSGADRVRPCSGPSLPNLIMI